MIRPFTCVGILALVPGTLMGQAGIAPSAPPAFDIADVHMSAHVTNPRMRGGVLRAGRYDVRTASMLDLISDAWTTKIEKLWGGPPWLALDRLDITARAPANTPPETVKLMLQTLLKERFSLKVHRDNKPMQAYVLSVGKGGKSRLKTADGSTKPGCQSEPQNSTPGVIPYNIVNCYSQTLDQIAQDLRDMGLGYLTAPVVNQTGIEGMWDFTIKWSSRASLAAAGPDGISLFDAVEKQLGLKLWSGKVPVSVLVIDSVNETPSPNPPGISDAFPPPPSQFEVATIRPSNSDDGKPSSRLQNGRFDAQNIPLRLLLEAAWDNLPDELLADAPKFLDSARYDIVAKAPPPLPGTETDEEDLRRMLRTLLADRFMLKTRMEDRPVEGYVLFSVKPKMAKADPANRTGCHEGPGPDGKDPRVGNPVIGRLLTCQNMTMAQFAAQLPSLANGYARVDVLDATELTGAYDFTVAFSNIGQLRGNGSRQPLSADGNDAAEPNWAISLPDAINRQLGLKLEIRKRMMPVLVIDHIEEKPTDN